MGLSNAWAQSPVAPRKRIPRGRSRITIDGALYLMLMSFIFVCAMNTGGNLLYLVFSLLLSTLLLCWFSGWQNMRRLTMRRYYPMEFHAGQAIGGQIEIANGKRHSYSHGLRVYDRIHGPIGHPRPDTQTLSAFVLEVPGGAQTRAGVELCMPRRGLYSMQDGLIVSRFPFAVLEHLRHQPGGQRVLVLPRLLPTLAILPFVPRTLGDLETDQKGLGSGLYGVRDYQRGDPARIIHWKHSARGQGYKVKEFEREEARGFRLMLDLHMPEKISAAQEEDFEKAVSVAASLARMLMRRGMDVGLWTSAGNVPTGNGPEHLMRILRSLAQVQPLAPAASVVVPGSIGDRVDELWIQYQSEPAGPSNGEGRSAAHRTVVDARRVQVMADATRAAQPA